MDILGKGGCTVGMGINTNLVIPLSISLIHSLWLIITIMSKQHIKDITFHANNYKLCGHMFVNVRGISCLCSGQC